MSEQLPAEPVPAKEPEPRRPGLVARIFAVLIPALICLGGVAFAGTLIATRPEAERATPEHAGVPVRVAAIAASTETITVRARGQVIAARQVVMQPQVQGRVRWVHEDLVPGGRLSEGDTLIRIDPRDFRAALQQQRAQVENSRLAIHQEESRQLIAQREWELLREERDAASSSGRELALREPQIRAAEAQLQASRSGVAQARTNLSRTQLEAPFDAIVQAENVDVGQLVGPTSQVATLVGTEHFWVQVAVPVEQLRWIRLPSDEAPGSPATVRQQIGEDDAVVRDGRVIRLLGDLDPVGRMARVLVEIDDPLGSGDGLPMLLGASVEVEIEAGQLEGVYRVPRAAVHSGDTVHLFGEGQLAIEAVEVAWRDEQSLLVRGLPPGAEIVLSPVSPAIVGTRLRRVEEDAGGTVADGGSTP